MIPVISRIAGISDRLGEYFYVNYGAQISSKKPGAFGKSDVVHQDPVGNAKPFFDGKSLSRYEIIDTGQYLDYRPETMYGPRVPELFESPKIVVRDVTGSGEQLIVSFDDSGMYCDHLLTCIVMYENIADTGAQTDFEGYTQFRHLIQVSYLLQAFSLGS